MTQKDTDNLKNRNEDIPEGAQENLSEDNSEKPEPVSGEPQKGEPENSGSPEAHYEQSAEELPSDKDEVSADDSVSEEKIGDNVTEPDAEKGAEGLSEEVPSVEESAVNADEENADEENADEENADEENADEENADEENADEENTDEENTDEENADEETADEETADEVPADEKPADVKETASSVQDMEYDESGVFKWYAVRIIAGHENKVKTYLDTKIKDEKLQHKIRNVLIPLEKVFEVKSGKKKVKMKNFLPGYILIEADLDDKIKRFISNTPSILNMVGSKSIKGQKLEPLSLKETEVKRIRAILNEESQSEKIDLKLSVGDPVKVTSGPFNNFNGNILEVNTEKMKVKVMVSIFGRKTPIELEFTQIEKEK